MRRDGFPPVAPLSLPACSFGIGPRWAERKRRAPAASAAVRLRARVASGARVAATTTARACVVDVCVRA